MFTGLIETIGTVLSIDRRGDVTNLIIEAPEISPELSENESISVSGAVSYTHLDVYKRQLVFVTI